MKKSISLLCAFFVLNTGSYAQDQFFLNTNNALIHLNPSFAGSNGGIRHQSSFQAQMSPYSGAYTAYQSSTDGYLKRLRAGLALSVTGDNLGPVTDRKISLTYARHFSLGNSGIKLVPSIQGGYGERILSTAWIVYPPAITPQSRRKDYFDLTAGLLMNYKDKFYFGGSVSHLNQPDLSVPGYYTYRLPVFLNVHCSYSWQVTEQIGLQFSGLFQRQGIFSSALQINSNLIFRNHFIAGIGYMIRDMPMVKLGYRTNYFSVTGTYAKWINNNDILLMDPTAIAELNVSFNLRRKDQRISRGSFESW